MGTDTTPTEKQKPLLDLDTLLERPLIKIDGVSYELITPDEFTVVEHRRLFKLGQRVEAIEAKDDPTEADCEEHDKLLTAICQKVLVAPADLIASLSLAQRAAIVLAFSQLRLMKALSLAGALAVTGRQAVKATRAASESAQSSQKTGEKSATA